MTFNGFLNIKNFSENFCGLKVSLGKLLNEAIGFMDIYESQKGKVNRAGVYLDKAEFFLRGAYTSGENIDSILPRFLELKISRMSDDLRHLR